MPVGCGWCRWSLPSRGHRDYGSPRCARWCGSHPADGGVAGHHCRCRTVTIYGFACRRCTAAKGGRPTRPMCSCTCRGANEKKSELVGTRSIASRYGSFVGSQRHLRADLRGALPPCARLGDLRESRDDRVDGPADSFRAAVARGAIGGAPCAVRACPVPTATRAQPSRRIHTRRSPMPILRGDGREHRPRRAAQSRRQARVGQRRRCVPSVQLAKARPTSP